MVTEGSTADIIIRVRREQSERCRLQASTGVDYGHGQPYIVLGKL